MEAKEYFKNHPSRKECFQTSDGYIFHLQSDAVNHAKSLKDESVNHITTGSVEVEKEAATENSVNTPVDTGKKGATKKATVKKTAKKKAVPAE